MIVTAAQEKSIVGERVQLGETVHLSTMFIMGFFNILTCIPEELMVVIYNHSSFGIVKSISTIIAAFRDFPRWNTVC